MQFRCQLGDQVWPAVKLRRGILKERDLPLTRPLDGHQGVERVQ